jgi:hypothetical protein
LELREIEHGSTTATALGPHVVVDSGFDAGSEWPGCNLLSIPLAIVLIHAIER